MFMTVADKIFDTIVSSVGKFQTEICWLLISGSARCTANNACQVVFWHRWAATGL